MTNALNRRLREILVPGAGLMMAGAGNALAARFIEAAGFPTMMVSGAAVANSYLGIPDIGLVSVTELAAHVAAIREVTHIPILADADTGFGNALNARRTIQLLERAGANAIMIEDQTYPKRCGHFDGKDVIPKHEMVAKLKAAVDARVDGDLMILARTDARAVEGFEAALDRARAYQEAGADFLFIEAPLDREELLSIPKAVPGIHLCNMVIGGKTPLLPREQLAQAGYAAICYANAALQASMLAMRNVLGHLNARGSIEGVEDQLMMFAERQRVLDAGSFKELEKRYVA
jgi:2-methylisocitrate lyase-like PEP mutase family enzyme